MAALYEISKGDKSIETKSRLMDAKNWDETE
jgi:hypothetical protein